MHRLRVNRSGVLSFAPPTLTHGTDLHVVPILDVNGVSPLLSPRRSHLWPESPDEDRGEQRQQHSQAMPESKRQANSKVVEMVLTAPKTEGTDAVSRALRSAQEFLGVWFRDALARNRLKRLVAGDCNAPNALTLPFRFELHASYGNSGEKGAMLHARHASRSRNLN
jgi:hypothetical protein